MRVRPVLPVVSDQKDIRLRPRRGLDPRFGADTEASHAELMTRPEERGSFRRECTATRLPTGRAICVPMSGSADKSQRLSQSPSRSWSGTKPWRTPQRTAWVRLWAPILR